MNKIVVNMNRIGISSEETPIIGTTGLGPCVGVLLHSKSKKKALVAHLSTNWKYPIFEMLVELAENQLISIENFKKCTTIFELFEKYDFYDVNHDLLKKFIKKLDLELEVSSEEDVLEIVVIPGYYPDNYNIAKSIKILFESFKPLIRIRTTDLPKKAIRVTIQDGVGSNEFFFDANTNKFVTEKVAEKEDPKGFRL